MRKPVGCLLRSVVVFLFCLVTTHCEGEIVGTSFTYQGLLSDGGQPANGLFDMTFSLHDNPTTEISIGQSYSNQAVAVSNGLFLVKLEFDPGVLAQGRRWLQIGVRTNGSEAEYVRLDPRQEITPEPVALYALEAATAASATTLAGGTSPSPLTLANPSNFFAGKFSGDGRGLTNVVYYLDARKDFGAVGDGAADDTVALQSAINSLTNAGGSRTLRIPAGRYRVNDTLHIPNLRPGAMYAPMIGTVTIGGEGWGSTLLISDMTDRPVLSFVSRDSATLGLSLENFGIIGPLVSSWDQPCTAEGIIGGIADTLVDGAFGGAQYTDFKNLYISGFSKAVAISNVWAPTFTHCLLTSNRLAGIDLMDCHYTHITGCGVYGFPGQETGHGISFYPTGGVQATVISTSISFCTNGLWNEDVTLTVIGSEFEDNGAALTALRGFPVTMIGCGFSELFGNTGVYSVTNGHPGIVEAGGNAAHALTVIAPVIECDDQTPGRAFFSTFSTTTEHFDHNGMAFYLPQVLNYPGPYLTGWWDGTNAYKVYPLRATDPTYSGRLTLTNQPPMVTSGAPHGLVIVDGNEDGALCIGGDANQGSSLTGSNSVSKIASIRAPSVYTGQFDTTLLGWCEQTAAAGNGGILGIGGSGCFTAADRNAPLYIDFFTKPFSLPPNAGSVRWRIDDTGTLASQNGSSLDLGSGQLKVGEATGLTTNINVLGPGNQVQQLQFKNGILTGVVSQ